MRSERPLYYLHEYSYLAGIVDSDSCYLLRRWSSIERHTALLDHKANKEQEKQTSRCISYISQYWRSLPKYCQQWYMAYCSELFGKRIILARLGIILYRACIEKANES